MVKDLTEGKPEVVLWKFSLPMFISVIFQQMYNIADSIIAGKFAGEEALAAVGASYPITMIFMAIAVGSNIGCSVVISQYFGAKEYKQMKTAISTTLIVSFALSICLTALGLLGANAFMRAVRTPGNIFYDGSLYLKIYIGGFLFLFLYNVSTGIFQSLGDSKTPLYFLIGSSLGNIALDYLFVAVFHFGVAGVAWATFITQGIASLMAFFTLLFRLRSIESEGENEKFSLYMLKKVGYVAIPSILQQSFISIGNMLIQGLVNGYGSAVIAGYSAAIKLNTFTITSFTTLANGLSSFSAQNIGAGKQERVERGFIWATAMAVGIGIPFFLLFFFFGREMISMFLSGEEGQAFNVGIEFLKRVSPFYFVICIKLMADGVLRGGGVMTQFMAATFCDLVIRVLLAFSLSPLFGTSGIWSAWPIGWTISMVLSCLFYFKGNWKIKKR